MLKTSKISKNYGTKIIFSDISFNLEKGQRVALVGPNGAGKTTLLRIIAGLELADSGKISVASNTKIGYLSQDSSLVGNETVREYFEKTQTPEHQIKTMLTGFGMSEINLGRSLDSLSSGQKSKLGLIHILLSKPHLLLLDEPTNNLDIPALIWLENFLIKTNTACVIISHDREFLDKVANHIWEINHKDKTLMISNGLYSEYLDRKRKERESLKKKYSEQQEEIERLANEIREKKRKLLKADKMSRPDNDKLLSGFKRDQVVRSLANSTKSMEKRLERIKKIEKPKEQTPLSIPLEAQNSSRPVDIILKQVAIGYPGKFELGPIDLAISYGQRVCFLGLNGSGKSTLLKTITRQLAPLSGQILIGSGLKIGNVMQEHETLPREETLLNFVKERMDCHEQEVFAILARFGFNDKNVRGKIADISPGERARLLLAIFSLLSVNALVLDEPTNHLDIEAVDALEEVLDSYQGTVVLVSHDRYFLEKARIDSIYLLDNQRLTKIDNFNKYIQTAEEQAKKLLRTV